MDDETGEINYRLQVQKNAETGEEEYFTYGYNDETGEKEYYSIDRLCETLKMPNLFKVNRYTTQLTTIVRYENARKHSERHTEFITAVVFLIPTFIIFTPLLGVFILTFDILLHKWCHRQNSKLKQQGNNEVYYQSPLHTIYKEFCAKCVAEEECKKIKKIQDIRYNKKKYTMQESLRRVVA